MSIMISLVGEQPAPNLLPIRRYKPATVVLAYTDRTERVQTNIASVIGGDTIPLEVHPYEMESIRSALQKCIACHGWSKDDLIFNITGGTKPMAIAAYGLAQSLGALVYYFQTEGGRSIVYRYSFSEDGQVQQYAEPDEIPDSITLDDYLRLYLGEYTCEPPRNELERAVLDVLSAEKRVDEVMSSVRPRKLSNVEIDFVVRCKNQVGIGEIKTTGNKEGVDQLTAVAEQRYLGAYIAKFLTSARPFHPHQKELAKAYRITLIELPSYTDARGVSQPDSAEMLKGILTRLNAF